MKKKVRSSKVRSSKLGGGRSKFEVRSSKLGRGTSNVERRTPNIKPRTSNLERRTPPGGGLGVRASYEAAAGGRRLRMWSPGTAGPNHSILGNLETLRARSRDSVRNNGWIRKGVNAWVSNEIGTGIVPRAVTENKDFNKACDALWERWVKQADADHTLDWYGIQSLSTRSRRESGELFHRFRLRSRDAGLAVPLQIQLLEAEFCPISENHFFQPGRRVRAGVEFNGIGERVAYHMYKAHPGDSFFFEDNLELVRVPADMVLHHYAVLRPGQVRGVPETVQALISAKIFEEYRDAESVRKRDRSTYTGAIHRASFDDSDFQFDPFSGEKLEKDSSGVGIQNVQPGQMVQLYPGEDVTLYEGDKGGGYAEFVRQELLRLFSAMDVPYEYGSGDMSEINDRVLRAINIQFYRSIQQSQWHLTVPQVCQPTRERFIETAVSLGLLDAPGYERDAEFYFATAWGPQAWQYLHPVQEVQTKILEIKHGLSSQQRSLSEQGEVAEEVDRENAEDKARQKELGLQYDTAAEVKPEKEPEADDDEEPKKAAQARGRKFRAVNAAFY